MGTGAEGFISAEHMELLNYEAGTGMIRTHAASFQPSVEDVPVEGLLHALYDPVRVAITPSSVERGGRRIARTS